MTAFAVEILCGSPATMAASTFASAASTFASAATTSCLAASTLASAATISCLATSTLDWDVWTKSRMATAASSASGDRARPIPIAEAAAAMPAYVSGFKKISTRLPCPPFGLVFPRNFHKNLRHSDVARVHCIGCLKWTFVVERVSKHVIVTYVHMCSDPVAALGVWGAHHV